MTQIFEYPTETYPVIKQGYVVGVRHTDHQIPGVMQILVKSGQETYTAEILERDLYQAVSFGVILDIDTFGSHHRAYVRLDTGRTER